MKKNITVILILLLTGNAFCQVQTEDIYIALNQLIEINNIEVLNKKAESYNMENPSEDKFIDWCINAGDKRIDWADVDTLFIKNQNETIKEIKWDKSRIDKKIKLRKKSVDYITIPLFLSKKMDLMIIYHFQYYGPTAAEGKYELYKKVNNKWKLINVLVDIIS